MTSVTIGSPDLHVEDPNLIGRRWRTGVLLLILADACVRGSRCCSPTTICAVSTRPRRGFDSKNSRPPPLDRRVDGGSRCERRRGVRLPVGTGPGSGRGAPLAVRGRRPRGDADRHGGTRWCSSSSSPRSPWDRGQRILLGRVHAGRRENLFHLLLTFYLGWRSGTVVGCGIYDGGNTWQVQLVGCGGPGSRWPPCSPRRRRRSSPARG